MAVAELVAVNVCVADAVKVCVALGVRVLVGVGGTVDVGLLVHVAVGNAVCVGVGEGVPTGDRCRASACSSLSNSGTVIVLEPFTVATTAPVISSVMTRDAGSMAGQKLPRSMVRVAALLVVESLKIVR